MHGRPQGALAALGAHVLGCVATGAQPLVPLRHSRHVTAILDALHRSAATGAAVPVPA